MTRKSKIEGESIVEETISECSPVTTDQPVSEELILLIKFEDLTISQRRVVHQEGSEGSISYITVIDKKTGGISDHTYNMFASGEQKNWYLYRENEPVLDTGSQRGNRPFLWEGILSPGLYTLGTGPAPNYSKARKYHVPGRGYKVQFRI